MSSKSWKLDHSFDESIHGDKDSVDYKPGADDEESESGLSDVLETPEERKGRKRSHWVAYITMFVMSIGFSIVLSSVWPYLHKLDPTKEKDAIGWVVAANPLGQLIASPLLGYWGNKAGSIRWACITTIICFIGGNVMYACLYGFVESGSVYAMMILSRFIVGVSSANISLCRSYIASSTTMKERTTAISIIAAAQALGFVVGPGIQAVLVVVVKETTYTGVDGIVWDKFTSAGWVAAILGFINLVIIMPCIFQEYNIAAKEQKLAVKGMPDDVKVPEPDYVGICGILFAFFFDLFIYVLLETLAEPFVQDQYATTEDYAIVAVGAALMAGGSLSIIMYWVTSVMAKKYDERMFLIVVGMIPTVIGTFIYLPWGDRQIQIAECNDTLTSTPVSTTAAQVLLDSEGVIPHSQYSAYNPSMMRSEEEPVVVCTLGCPPEQTWCEHVPMLPVAQLVVAYVITISAFPVIQALCQTIFSKMLGPKPQGVWFGVLTGTGSLARVMGPIFVSYVYTYYGTYWTFGILEVGMILALIELIVMYPRLVPMKLPTKEEIKGHHDVGKDNESDSEEEKKGVDNIAVDINEPE